MSKVVYLHLQNLCQTVIISKIKRFVWVAALCFVSIAVQAQNNTHQSINQVLEQNVGKETNLSYQIPEEEKVPSIIISGNVAYKLKTVVHKVNDSKQDIFAENFDNIYPGAIVYADQDLAKGDPTLVGLDYGTVTVRVDFNTGKGKSASVSGVKNSADAIQEAIYSILQTSDYQPSVKLNYKKAYVSSVAKMAVNLGVNVSFWRRKPTCRPPSPITSRRLQKLRTIRSSIIRLPSLGRWTNRSISGLTYQVRMCRRRRTRPPWPLSPP